MSLQKASFLFLGTGGATGIPMIGCECSICKSTSPQNKRWRSSGLIHLGELKMLIDAGPDFRNQALKYKINSLDGLLLTHTHFDHIAGIDELRSYYFRTQKSLPCLLSIESFEDLKKKYHYLFQPIGEATTVSAQLEFTLLDQEEGAVDFLGKKVHYVSYFQGKTKVTGFRLGDFAYITDIRDFDESIFVSLKGVRKLVLSAPRKESSPIHFSLKEAVAFAQKVGAEETKLTHLSHSIEHDKINSQLPDGIALAYDGLEMEFNY